ncbi:MAG: class I SAM-dependent methyltransferase [Myxococcota bacterium]
MKNLRTFSLLAVLFFVGCGSWKRCAYEDFGGRDDWQNTEQVIAALEIRPGDRVADLGAGGGYFTFRLADAVGPKGMVYAVDVDDDMIEYLNERVAEEGHANVRVVRGEFADPLLPDGQIDLLFTSNTYHHIEDRVAYFKGVRRDLRPGGRVAVLELNDREWFPRTFGHYTAEDVIVQEMTEAGYQLDKSLDLTERQSFTIFVSE